MKTKQQNQGIYKNRKSRPKEIMFVADIKKERELPTTETNTNDISDEDRDNENQGIINQAFEFLDLDDKKNSLIFSEIDLSEETIRNTGDLYTPSSTLKPRFYGTISASVREKYGRRCWTKGLSVDYEFNDVAGNLDRKENDDISRSQYSLVSCGELNPAALELWLSLPEEVKYDPALAPFRRFYEKEHGTLGKVHSRVRSSNRRLPTVNSAPHLNNNVQIINEALLFQNNENIHNSHDEGIEMPPPESKENPESKEKLSKMAQAGLWIKISALLACWMFFTSVFIIYSEKETVTRQSFLLPEETKEYHIESSYSNLRVSIDLTGPFKTDLYEEEGTKSSSILKVWLVKSLSGGTEMTSKAWLIPLNDKQSLDFTVGETLSTLLRFEDSQRSDTNSTKVLSLVENSDANTTDALRGHVTKTDATYSYAIRMKSTSKLGLPFSMQYTEQPLEASTGVLLSILLLCGLYFLIIFEIINRTMAAVMMASLALGVLAVVGERPSLPELVSWLDVETLLLLFSMMVLVALMAETGMFDYLAVFTFQMTKGKIWPLIILLCAITALVSTFLDNVTTVLLMTPVTIRLCEVMELDPIPVLISMVFYSNIGGTATPVGDPPNVIIASNKIVIASGIHFTNFTVHLTVGIVFVCVQTYFQLRFIYRDTNDLRLKVPRDVEELRRQISIWRAAYDALPTLSKDEQVVKDSLEKNITRLNSQLQAKIIERNKVACPKEDFETTLKELKDKYKIRDKVLLVKALVAITFVVFLFFLHSLPELRKISLGWTALLGSILLLILSDRDNLEPVLHRVEWATLIFFAALFVLMEALTKLGFIVFIGSWTEYFIMSVGESYRLAVALLLILWVSGVTSAFVDNIPLTTMMVRVVTTLGTSPTVNLPVAPLIWALAFGACLGGNGTLIGASANLVCAGVAQQHGYRISFTQFFKIGFPIMIGHLLVSSVYLLVCHCLFTWH